MRSHSKGKQLLTRRLWGSIHWQWAKEIANKISKLGEPRQVKPHVKYINSISPTLPAPFIFFKVFFISYFWAKTYLGISMWNRKKKSTRRGKNYFFSYHVVKVGKFIKLSYASEDIASRGFSRNWRWSLT